MFLSDEEERALERIRNTGQLTEEELKAIAVYFGHKNAKELGSKQNGIGSPLHRELKDILKIYS